MACKTKDMFRNFKRTSRNRIFTKNKKKKSELSFNLVKLLAAALITLAHEFVSTIIINKAVLSILWLNAQLKSVLSFLNSEGFSFCFVYLRNLFSIIFFSL